MNSKEKTSNDTNLECCPVLDRKPVCDTLDLRYKLPFQPKTGDNRQTIPVEVILHFRLERCSGPLVMGDPVYSTTLLPGEKVRLFTSDRHSRWSYDSESNLSYRHETTSEESFYTAGMARAMSDLTINESGSAESSYGESWAEGGGGASLNLGFFEIGGGGGSYDADSASSFSRSLSRHAESSSSYVAASVRAKSATAVGEVESRNYAEGESEAQYESSSRTFKNPNKCSAVTYLFHKINKTQRVRFKLVAIERRVDDIAAPTSAHQRVPLDTTGKITVLPQTISATSKRRLEIEEVARTSVRNQAEVAYSKSNNIFTVASSAYAAPREPISRTLRQEALSAVDKDLSETGLLDLKSGKPTEKIIVELSWEREEIIPTPGIIVKGCLDGCDTCDPYLQQEIELDLHRKHLENKMLEREIELMDQAQEYRCCPEESTDYDEDE